MSTPTFLEKLDEYIECLDNAAELAFQHSNEIGLADDYTPICDKCHKRRKLDFDESFPKLQDDSFISDSSFENSYSKSLIRNSKTRLLSRQGSLKDDSRNDKTFVSAMLKTLVTLNSSSESLNLSSNHNPSSNETTRAKKGTFLKRRHTLLDENAFMLSANANAAVSIAKTNTELPTTNKAEISGAKKDNSAILRSKVSRRPRPLSYPNRQYLLRQATAHNLCKDNMSQIGAKISCDASAGKEEVSLSGPSEMTSNNINNNRNTNSRNCAKQLNRSQPISIKTSTNEGRSHQIYYSLSPTLLDAPLRLAELGKTTSESTVVVKKLDMGFEDSANGVLGIGDLENNETNQLSYDSSLSSNPEYFSVISKRKKRLRKKLQNNQSGSKFGSHFLQNNHLESEFGSHSLPANISKADDTDKTRSACDRTQAPGMQDLRTLHGRQCSQSLDDLTNRNLERTQLSDLDMTLDSGNTSYLHGDGLLYTSSFGIGDHGWCSNLGDSDMAIDGYCKCSFCNHDMILTPMKSETQVIPPGNDVYEKDFATMHDELLRLRSTSNNSMTSLHTSHYEPRTDLQTDHFPYPRLPKEFMTSQNDASVTSQLDISMEIACSCDEDSTAGDNNSMRVSPIQKALQRDIEKHSSGVASVLNLCEVLLHDGDACSNDSEKDSIEQATSSLDRRWRNICSLSMGRKLKIEETQRLWRKFMEDYSRFNDWLKLAENVVSHPNSSEVAYAVAREELKKFESFQRQVHESLTQLELINKQYRRLARENRTDATNKLKHMIHDGNSRWDAISHRVTAIMRRLKHTICRRDEFETSRESLVVWLTETDLRLTNVEHFSQSENFDKLKEVKNFQATIEEHIPRILQLDIRGQLLIEKSEGLDSVIVEEELSELHRYCKEVVARLDRYHKRLLRIMNEPSPLDSSLFEDTELAQMNWFESYIGETSSSRNSSPGSLSPDHDRLLATPRSQQNGKLHSSRHSNGSHSGRATPESLEWDLYDISQSELETKDNGALTDDGSIPEISPLEEDDDIPLLHISRDSNYSRDNASRRSYDRSTSLDNDDLSPPKKLRTSQDDQRTQFMNDLVATMAWLDATIKVTDQEKKKSESNFDKTIGELEQEVKEQRTLQKSLEQRKPIVLSIRLVSSSFCDDDITKRLSRMNKNWESLQQKSIDWNKSLQESLLRSQEFQITVSQLTSWVDLQSDRRDDMSMIQQRESADSSPTSKMQKLRRDHKVLDQMRIDTLEAVSKVTTLQDICILLTKSSKIVPPVDGTRAVSDKVRSTNGRLKSLLDAVRSDLRDVEYKIKATRRRVREEQSSESDAESSEDKIRSNRLKMLQRKVEASELHSSGKDPNNDNMATVQHDYNDVKKIHSDITEDSLSSIDGVTHRSLHAGTKRTRRHTTPKTVIGKIVASKQTITAAEKSGVTFEMSAKRTTKTKSFTVVRQTREHKSAGLCCRVCVAALPFYFLMLLLLLLPWFLQAGSDDGYACLRKNNYAFSFTPMLTYTNGPPPV